jgi:type I restriction enzyme S subunit
MQLKERFKEEDSMGGGTIFKAVSKDDMHEIKVMVPPMNLILSFEEIVNPILGEIKNLTVKNGKLRTTRDILLPKLISGELDVSELDIAMREQGA